MGPKTRRCVDDYANRVVASVFDAVAPQEGVLEEIKRLLATKRERARDEEEYAEVLLRNLQFFVNMEGALLALFERYLTAASFPGIEEFNSFVEKIASEERQEKEVSVEFRLAFSQFDDLQEKLDNLEFDFSYHRIYYPLLGAAVSTVVGTEVKYELTGCEASEVLDLFKRYASFYANMMLGNVRVEEQGTESS